MLTVKAQDFDNEIKSLDSDEKISAYWNELKVSDQLFRGLETKDSIDNLNFKKAITLIKYHGYPKGSYIPNIIFTHQRSAYVREYYFPIFHKAYLDGYADTSWFCHNVNGMHRSRYERDYVNTDSKNYHLVLGRLNQWINKDLSYDLSPFDSLYQSYLDDVNRIIATTPIYKWKSPNNSVISIYEINGIQYFHKMWADSSYAMPQIIERINQGWIIYSDSIGKINYRIEKNGNLSLYHEQKIIENYDLQQ